MVRPDDKTVYDWDAGNNAGERKDWDGKTWNMADWFSDEAFVVAGLSVSKGAATGIGAGTIVIIVASILFCCGCCYWQREPIAEGGRRATIMFANTYDNVRRTIVGRDN